MESTALPATAPIVFGGMLTLLGIVFAWLVIRPGGASGRRTAGKSEDAEAARGGGSQVRLYRRRKGVGLQTRRVWRQTASALQRGELSPGELLRLGMYHFSKAAAVASLALLFGAALGLIVRWLLGN